MKKRILALLLSGVLCLSLLGTAFATELEERFDSEGNSLGFFEKDEVIQPTTPQPSEPSAPSDNTWDLPFFWDTIINNGAVASQPSTAPVETPAEEPVETPSETPVEAPASPVMPFIDVNAGDWFYGAVQYVYEQGIMTGDGSVTTFNPNGNMTRAMVWTVLGRLSGADVSSSGGAWYAKAQSWAISSGISDGTNPNGSITREELVTMLWRYAGSPYATADLSVFSDSASVSSWANAAIQWAVSMGILAGNNGRLNPRATATRAEVATILMRYCEIIVG